MSMRPLNTETIEPEALGCDSEDTQLGIEEKSESNGKAGGSGSEVSRSTLSRKPGTFKRGNKMHQRRNGDDLGAAVKKRLALQRAMVDAVTPAKARACVRRMLEIITAKRDPRASVQAFKVLYDILGARPVEAEGSGPRVFAFVLPQSGEIPEGVAEVMPKRVENESESPDPIQ